MDKKRKFGTFGGVFTPSILTILGVIMYLRLPWIVGQAGLWVTIGIIVIAHIISVTTGLSVASIATDKRVKAGGIYYIISRSLGLPIGGTLGIALFVGLSFSVSLYIIGFIESLLPVLGIEPTLYNIRLYGTLATLVVISIVLISTSLAIKTQYLVLAAIVLSLISIFFGKSSFAPASPLFQGTAEAESLMVLFSVFFPAVTGFTAGVQMSGDLKDPKKAIPIGTMAAIGVGFVVYVGVAIFMAFRIDAQNLIHNGNILREIALVPAFLLAGIWGATLSSAMGSLLGAPRILQAMSADRITPKIFAKGYGPSNEPRNALVLTFMIAEIGILIAELNIIAAIISIFFITTYGFINLSCAIETWASPDFRPSFRIPKWASILGAGASFIVMIELDLLSFIGSTLILGILYIYLQRKELTLESGDTWEGVWSSVIRSGLHRLDKSPKHTRNWRPNIILFSGGISQRPHLIEFGKWIVNKRGILSNFDLKERPGESVLFPKAEQVLHDSEDTVQGVFSRQLECNDVYEGMEVISQVFGFSGVEPNTVMMGWARDSRNPQRFAHLVGHLSDLDYNILMLDYDLKLGFGQKKQIDIWWRGGSNNTSLELTILKFLTASEDWMHAEARILILVDDRVLINRADRNMRQILDEQRIKATVKVINNSIDKLPFTDVIKSESSKADLIMLGLPKLDNINAPVFVKNVNSIVADLGSTLLVHASSFFDPLFIGIEERTPQKSGEIEASAASEAYDLPALAFPDLLADDHTFDILIHTLKGLGDDVENILRGYSHDCMERISGSTTAFIEELRELVVQNFSLLETQGSAHAASRYDALLARVQGDCLFHLHRLFEEFEAEILSSQKMDLEHGLEQLLSKFDDLILATPEEILIFHDEAALRSTKSDQLYLRLLKFRKRVHRFFAKKSATVKLPLRKRLSYELRVPLPEAVFEHEKTFGIDSYQMISDLQKWLNATRDAFSVLESAIENNNIPNETLEREKVRLTGRLDIIDDEQKKRKLENTHVLLLGNRRRMQVLCDESTLLDVKRTTRRKYKIPKTAAAVRMKILEAPAAWKTNSVMMAHYAQMEIHLMAFYHHVNTVARKLVADLKLEIDRRLLLHLKDLESTLQSSSIQSDAEFTDKFQYIFSRQKSLDAQAMLTGLDEDIRSAVGNLPESIEIIDEDSFQQIETVQYEGIQTISINLRQLILLSMETELIDPLQKQFIDIQKQYSNACSVAVEVVRLVRFNLTSSEASEESGEGGLKDTQSEILLNVLKRIKKERESTEHISVGLSTFIRDRLNGIFGKMNPYLISRTAEDVDNRPQPDANATLLAGIEQQGNSFKNYISDTFVSLLYRRSEGVLLARKLSGADILDRASTDSMLDLTAKVSPRSDVLADLPFYYRQIFTGKQPIVSEFRVGQEVEMKQARTIIDRYRQGYNGGMLVIGEPDSGKTALCHSITKVHFEKRNTFQLFPPKEGCIDTKRFRKLLADLLQSSEDYEQMFMTMPSGSTIIFHDLELWWERSREGFAMIDEVIGLIDRYGDQCFFIVNCNTHSFRFINRVKSIDRAFLGIVNCDPFDAMQLQEAILLRHRSTGLSFKFGQQAEEQMSRYTLAKLFTKIFDYSAGNIGIALQTWICNIENIEAEAIGIHAARRPATFVFDQLEDEWYVVLQQFVLHKFLTVERLTRLFHKDASQIAEGINEMKRSGLILENQSGILRINPYLRPFVIQKLVEIQML